MSIVGLTVALFGCGGGADSPDPDANMTPDAGPASGEVLELTTFGDTFDDYGGTVARDGDGNIIVFGDFQGTIDLGGGPLPSGGNFNVFVAKWSADGTFVWQRRFGDNLAAALAVDASATGEIALVGSFQMTVDFGTGTLSTSTTAGFVAKLSPDGQTVWARALGGSSRADAYGVGIAANGDVLVAVQYQGTADFGTGDLPVVGGIDIAVARYAAADGAPIWTRGFGSDKGDYVWALALDSADGPLIVGDVNGVVDVGCGPLPYAGAGDGLVARLDPDDGACAWSRAFTSTSTSAVERAIAVTVDNADDVIVSGTFEWDVDFGGGVVPSSQLGDSSMFVAKYAASDGAFRWVKRIDGPSLEVPQWAATDPANRIYVTGAIDGPVSFAGKTVEGTMGGDVFVAALDADGTERWMTAFTGPALDVGSGVVVSGDDLLVTGYFEETADFGGFGATSTGGYDGYVVRMVP